MPWGLFESANTTLEEPPITLISTFLKPHSASNPKWLLYRRSRLGKSGETDKGRDSHHSRWERSAIRIRLTQNHVTTLDYFVSHFHPRRPWASLTASQQYQKLISARSTRPTRSWRKWLITKNSFASSLSVISSCRKLTLTYAKSTTFLQFSL